MIFETHIEEKDINKFTNLFPGFVLKWVTASRKAAMGRASGGSLYGIKVNSAISQCASFVKLSGRDVICVNICSDCFYIVPVYLNPTARELDFKKLSDILYGNSSLKICLVGDFNSRTGCLQRISKHCLNSRSLVENFYRRSKDNVVNKNGKALLELLEDFSLIILNGRVKGDLEGILLTLATTVRQSLITAALVQMLFIIFLIFKSKLKFFQITCL